MLVARVSNIEAFRKWREGEDGSLEDLVRFITTDEPTEAMKAGTAFHKAIEEAQEGEHPDLRANGYIFHMPDAEVALPSLRETRTHLDYGDLRVTGQADCVHGRTVIDHKTTSRFDAERYLSGAQWKFYLELFGADTFRWIVWEIREVAPRGYLVAPPQTLTAYRYPGMHEDCVRLAAEYLDFAKAHLPKREPEPWDFLEIG